MRSAFHELIHIMDCPNGDAQLHKHTITDHGGLSITYFRCPTCGGFWLDAFNANFIKRHQIHRDHTNAKAHPTEEPDCPVCKKPLTHTRGDNIPPGVSAWGCPDKHGYYFADKELIKFKEAQEAKISYHKLWDVPLPSVASVLLVGIGTFLITGGIVTTFIQAQKRQTIESRAEGILLSQQVIINAADKTVTFLVSTRASSTVSITIRETDVKNASLSTTDGLTHFVMIRSLIPGQYHYTFTITKQSGTIQSEEFPLILIP